MVEVVFDCELSVVEVAELVAAPVGRATGIVVTFPLMVVSIRAPVVVVGAVFVVVVACLWIRGLALIAAQRAIGTMKERSSGIVKE